MERSLRDRVTEQRWYHTIDLGGGLVTRGYVDARPALSKLPLPASLEGMRCLDVGTQNGFWAFELERRGAGSVVAIDLDDPEDLDWPARVRLGDRTGETLRSDDRAAARRAFELAKEILGSRVERMSLSVYDLAPELVGQFAFVFLGSLLLHLRDPVAALEKVRSVCSGEAVIADAVYPVASIAHPRAPCAVLDATRVWWWTPNRAALRRMVTSAGFDIVEESRTYFVPPGKGFRTMGWREMLRGGANLALVRLLGSPHAALRVRPIDPVAP
jgi:tRNA (mo5U34)-methyltransferase